MNIQAFLELALALLMAAQAPNVPAELKEKAVFTANTAISYAISSGLAPETKGPYPTPNEASRTPQATVASRATWCDSNENDPGYLGQCPSGDSYGW